MMRTMTSIVAVVAALTPGVASAAAGAHGEWTFAIEGWYLIDFVVFLALLIWGVRGPAKRFLKARHDRIKADLAEAERQQKKAAIDLADFQKLLAGLDAEVATITSEFEGDGQREKARIIAEAREQADRIRANVSRGVQQETAKLREELEALLVGKVLAHAEGKIKAQLSAASQRDMFNRYIQDLEKLEDLDRYAA